MRRETVADKEDTIESRIKAIPTLVSDGGISSEMGLDLKPGDFVEISGEMRSGRIYWRSRPEDAKMDIIRVDGSSKERRCQPGRP